MITALFGEVKDGRLARLPYFGYSVMIWAIMFAAIVSIVFAVGMGEQVVDATAEEFQQMLGEKIGGFGALAMLVLYAVLLFVGLNIMAKRFRDIGTPGWLSVLAVIIASIVLSTLVTADISSGFSLIVWLFLLFMPGKSEST